MLRGAGPGAGDARRAAKMNVADLSVIFSTTLWCVKCSNVVQLRSMTFSLKFEFMATISVW